MISSVLKKASRIVSIKDIDYELPIDTSFHPAFAKAAVERICEAFYSKKLDLDADAHELFTYALGGALSDPASHKVWAVVLEYKQNPLFVVQNLSFTRLPMHYRRVYRVNCDRLCEKRVESLNETLQKSSETIADHISGQLNIFIVLQSIQLLAFLSVILIAVFGTQEIATGRSGH